MSSRRTTTAGLAALGLLAGAMFAETLVAPGSRVLGDPANDLATHTLPWREFGFGELLRGNLALWNPHIFAGGPFFGGMQSALLYPPNWLFLFLPLPLALNWSIALNAWLLGVFVYLWASRRGLVPFAAFTAAALLMFCAPHFLRVQAGLLTNLAAMAWVPLVLLAIDGWLDSSRLEWCLLGMLAVALQVLAGQPQYVYYTGIIATVYGVARLAEARAERLRAAAGLLAVPIGAVLLSAVQLGAGLQATAETVRDRPLPFTFAASFSFPPENLITLLAPGFFGDIAIHPYWGRWYLWEASAFIGVGGLALALYGIAICRPRGRGALLAAGAAAVLLALGEHTPLFRLLFDWLPLFDRFRASGKFIFFGAVVLALFAGYGLDRVLRDRAVRALAAWAAAAGAATLLAASQLVRQLDWTALSRAMQATGQSYAASLSSPTFAAASQSYAALSLLVAGLTLSLVAGLAFWTRRNPQAGLLLGVLAVAEVFAFARLQRPTFDSAQAVVPQLRDFLAAHPGDYRILNLRAPNSAMLMQALDLWGYDPGVTRRYAELVHWSEGGNPDDATQYQEFVRFHPLLSMLRLKYVVAFEGNRMTIHPVPAAPLRRLELVGAYQLRQGRDAVLRALAAPSFDPRREVILEREPDPAPAGVAEPGRAEVVREGTDFLEVEAELNAPAVLLITDAWAPGWRATPLDGAARYDLMPANYALRAVALGRGRHRLRLEYVPAAFRAGAALSALAWAAWLGGLLLLRRRGRAHA
jgi:hypothetical protein